MMQTFDLLNKKLDKLLKKYMQRRGGKQAPQNQLLQDPGKINGRKLHKKPVQQWDKADEERATGEQGEMRTNGKTCAGNWIP